MAASSSGAPRSAPGRGSELEALPHSGRAVLMTTSLTKLALISLAATSVEWYDFFLYGTAAALVFPTVFFAGTLSPSVALIASFSTFAVGFVARPVGAVVFGHFGDWQGRKSALVAALCLMGGATTLIGCLPAYTSAGALAPVLLVLLRFLQGLAIGGQWGGAMLLITENAPPARRGFYGSFAQVGVPVGLILANLAFLLTSAAMNSSTFVNWGWRIPFLLSVVVVGFALFVQRHVEDSEVFRRQKAEGTSTSPILEALRQYPSQIALAAGAFIAVNATFYVLVTFVIAYGSGANGLQIPRVTMLTAVLISAVLMSVALIAAGAWSDRVGRRIVYRLGCVLVGAWAFVLFPLVDTRSLLWIAVAISVGNAACALMYGPQAALSAELFATRVRYSAASLGYQIGAIFGGGFSPIIAASLMGRYHASVAISIYIAAICAVSFISVTLLRETRHVDLNQASAEA
jgi:MFS family permease